VGETTRDGNVVGDFVKAGAVDEDAVGVGDGLAASVKAAVAEVGEGEK